MLLDRESFKNIVFNRDNYTCVMCGDTAQDAHHIIERKLWSDGGYYVDNGVSLCHDCHFKAEQTLISCDDLRSAANITSIILPDHLSIDQKYDKWGNIILLNGMRLKGELYFEEQVQKLLISANLTGLFLEYVKYPRTFHLPWSRSKTDDDKILLTDDMFLNKHVIITEKMDGENTSLYADKLHARSIEMDSHESRSWIKNFWNTIKHEIPVGWRICGENLYAKHSIYYDNLESYFMGFSIWNEKNTCLSWTNTMEWFELLNITSVPILYNGIYTGKDCIPTINELKQEGYVIRLHDSFSYGQFKNSIAKCVRKGHVTTDNHWKFSEIIPNKLRT